MEVLSLALLAAASGGLLAYKKKQKDDKKKKESFVTYTVIAPKDDSLFARTVIGSNGMPEIHNRFVQSATTNFNPLAALFNPSKVNFASNADSIYPAFQAPDNTTLQNMLQTSYTRNVSKDTIILNDDFNQKNVSKYRIPNSENITSLINTCELTPVITTPEGADCTVFDKPLFSRQCGVCHKNAVATLPPALNASNAANYGSNLNINGPYGLYVSPRLTTAVTEEINQRQTLASIGVKPQVYIPSPSLGECGKDPDTNQSYFSLSKDMCIATNKFINCKTNQNFSNTACYQCSANNKYYFIDKTAGNLTKRQETQFDIWGSGRVTIQMDDTMQYLTQPNSNNITSYQTDITYITLSSNRTKFILPFTSNSNISDDNGLEASDGKSLIINLSATIPRSPTPYIQGLFLGILPNETVKTTDFAITATAIVNSNEVLPYLSGDPSAYKLYPQILNGAQTRTATFKILIPYMYLDPSATEKNYCRGPFIRTPNAARKLNSLCYTSNDRPGNYSQECLQQMFLAAGCRTDGLGYPRDETTSSNLNGASRNLGDITTHVTRQYNRAWSGKDTNQSNLPMSEWQDSIKYCLDKNSVSADPCDLLPPSVRNGEEGADPVSDQCIRYIYENSQNPISREGFVTYSNVDARSLFNRPGLSNDRYCTEFGSISPMSNDANIRLAQSKGGVDAIKQFYNNIHSKANIQNMTNAERNQYMQQCYGKTLKVAANADPAIVNGKQVAQTSCGVKARYVKLTHTNKYIITNQIFVIDARGQNVALNKNVTSSSLASGYSLAGAVDAVAANRFKSLNTGDQWCMIDLDGIYDIMQIIYYNSDILEEMNQASDMQIMLLDYNGVIINNSIKTFTNASVQFFNYTSSTASTSCPSMYSGTRGDLLSPADRLVNVLVNDQGSYSVFTIVKPASWLGISTAQWIWNEPYAGGNAFGQSVIFTCKINNSTNVLKPYTFYYRASSTPTILFNNVTQIVSGNNTTTSTNPGSISIALLPGDNIIQVTVLASTGSPAGFIGAFSPNSGTTYENMTPTEWKSATMPKLGSYSIPAGPTQAPVLSPPSNSSTNNGSASLVQPTISNYPNIKSIWNQPDAWYGAATEIVIFYLSFVVSSDTIKTYTLVSTPFNTSVQSIELNGKNLGLTNDLPVVSGTNIIKVSVSNGGTTPKPAGIVLYIRDNNQVIISETQNSTNWKIQTDTNWYNNPCLYVEQGSNIPFKCASNVFNNAGCPRPFTNEAYPDTIKNMTSSGLLTEYTNNWASRTASSLKQTICKGITVCDTGYTYNSGTNKCERFYPSQEWYLTINPMSLKDCASMNYDSGCGETTRLEEKSDKSCGWNSGTCRENWFGSCRCEPVDCGIIHCGPNSGYRSYEDRMRANGYSETNNYCPNGFFRSGFAPNYWCQEIRPTNVEIFLYNGRPKYLYKCDTNDVRWTDGRCKTVQDPRF